MQQQHRNRCPKKTKKKKQIKKNNKTKQKKNKTELSRFKAAIFNCFEKSNQMKIELSDNEASAEVMP